MTEAQAIHELWYWRVGDGTNFHSKLYNLIAKADRWNRERIRLGFPEEVKAFEQWENADEKKLFESYGISLMTGA